MQVINRRNKKGPPATQASLLALRAGQTIIEAIIALSTILVILAAISVAITSSLNNSQYIRSQSLASKYAQQGMESLRYARNNDPTTFDIYSTGTYCMGLDNTPVSGSCTEVNIPDASLVREVIFEVNAGGCSGGKKVTMNVSWSSGKCLSGSSSTFATRYCHKTQLISCLSKESTSGSTL